MTDMGETVKEATVEEDESKNPFGHANFETATQHVNGTVKWSSGYTVLESGEQSGPKI